MIQGITNLNSYLNTMKMQTIWDIAKQNPEKAKIEKQQKQKEISKRISDIRTKLKSGKKLSEKEMSLLLEIMETAEPDFIKSYLWFMNKFRSNHSR